MTKNPTPFPLSRPHLANTIISPTIPDMHSILFLKTNKTLIIWNYLVIRLFKARPN